jgi:predicted transcriptional regulator
MFMTIELSRKVEEQLRDLAGRQGREVGALVEDAVREYLEAIAITDLDAAEVAETQVALVGELRGVPEWKDGRE